MFKFWFEIHYVLAHLWPLIGSAKLARQAQSKEKTLAKMVAGGLTGT